MKAWMVFVPDSRGNFLFDGEIRASHDNTVFYDDDCDEDYIKQSLINHDGYPTDILLLED